MSKWSKPYLIDLSERVATTAIYGLIAMLTADASGVISGDPQQWWVVVGLPTVLALLKGLLANLADPASGPSVVPSPPAPDVNADRILGKAAVERREDGNANVRYLATVALLVVAVVVVLAVIF